MQMKTDVTTTDITTIAASVAPEDLKCGDFVAISSAVFEVPSYLWTNLVTTERELLLRMRCIPAGTGLPLKIKAICLPFVFVRPPVGPFETIDIRRVQLMRLDESYGRRVWKWLRKPAAKLDGQELGR